MFVSKDSFGGGVGCKGVREGTVEIDGGSLAGSANMTVLTILGCCLGCCVFGLLTLVLDVLEDDEEEVVAVDDLSKGGIFVSNYQQL